MNLLSELIIILTVSAIVLYFSTRMNLPSVVGLLLAGIVVGPYSTGLISSIEAVDEMAEIGILLLLFSIGIEFSLEKLMQSRRFILIGGTLQVLFTMAATFLIGSAIGLPWQQALFVGMLFSMSSTAIVLQLFQEKGWTNTLFGRNAISILIFQDIVIIPMMLLTPYLFNVTNGAQGSLYQVGIAVLIVIMTVFAARKIIPSVLRHIVHSRNQDLFLISIIVICFATAFITYELGLKLALGAFLAGLIISESEYSFEALKNIKPFKKIFTSLFFVSVGMLLNLSFFFDHIMLIAGITIGVILLKMVIVMGVGLRMKLGLQNALLSGLALSQVGEFAFILSKVGIDLNVIDNETYQLFLSVSILSMITTAIMINKSRSIVDNLMKRPPLNRWFNQLDPNPCMPSPCNLENHVVLIGFGPGGKRIADSLLKENKAVAVIENNDNNFTEEFRGRVQEIVGNATDPEILQRAGVAAAQQIIITVPEAAVAENLTRRVRSINAHSQIIVRSRYESEVEELEKLGADYVVPEEVTVAEMIKHTLLKGT